MIPNLILPKWFHQKIIDLFGVKGDIWLNQLPFILSELINKWHLVSIQQLDTLSYNYLFKAFSNKLNSNVIIKISCNSHEILQEAKALKYFNSQGCINLLDYDESFNALLLEEIKPATTLASYSPDNDNQAIKIYTDILENLHNDKSIKHNLSFPTIKDWLQGLATNNKSNQQLNYHIEKAKKISFNLINNFKKLYILHGDLHHNNILKNGHSWLAIDPKGVIGDLEYEVGAFIRNPTEELMKLTNVKQIISNRCEIFSKKLNLDFHRIKNWAYIQSVLASCWAENHVILYEQFISLTEVFEDLD